MDSKPAIYMANNGKETKYTRNTAIRMHLVINGEECNLKNIIWREGGLQLTDIVTKNVRED